MNPRIAQAQQVALDILKPSRAQIERGTELHRDTLVIESYGFAPNSPIDGDALREAVEAGASDLELQDLREEMTMTRHVHDAALRREYMDAWEAAGITCVLQNAGEESQSIWRLIKRLARFTYVTDRLREFVTRAATPDDIVAAKRGGRHCLYMTANGVPLLERWDSVEEELGAIGVLYQLGVRMMHLTYNRRNMIGDGCAEASDAGLSDFGRAVVTEMNRVGVIVDVAHSGRRTSLEAARLSSKPMVASHTACAALNDHYRCKPDEVIRAIADTDGYVGVCCIPYFLGGSGDIVAMLDHIEHIARAFGPEYVAIGTDVAYQAASAETEWAKVPSRGRRRAGWESLWPPSRSAMTAGDVTQRQTLSMAWTNWPVFTIGLVQRGYSDDEIRAILGGNALRVARAVQAP